MMKITEDDWISIKSAKTLNFIVEYMENKNYCPSYREIAKNIGVPISSLYDILYELQEYNHITYYYKKPRAIEVKETVLKKGAYYFFN